MRELDEVRRLVAGLDPLGVCLYGSAVHGGLRPNSDLDVFVVTQRRLMDGEKRRLFEGLRAIEGRAVEVTVVARPDEPGRVDFHWGGRLPDGWQEGPDPDLTILVHLVLSAGRTLHGPPARTLLEPPTSDALPAAMFASVEPIIAGLHEDPTNAILTLCRIYFSLVTGAIAPKAEAAAWAHARFPHEALRRAQHTYVGGLPERYEGVDLDYAAENLRALIAQQDRA